MSTPTRRTVLTLGTGAIALLLSPAARATTASMAEAIRAFTNGKAIAASGVSLDIPLLLESGNSVPAVVKVDSPMSEDNFVRKIALFNEKNPLPNVAIFHLTPQSGRAWVSTRIRLSDSQKVMAVAEMSDGSFRSGSIEVIVTLPACVEQN